MKKNYIFDIGNVLIRWNPKELVVSLMEADPEFPRAIAHIPDSKEWQEFDRGSLRSADLIDIYSNRFTKAHLRKFMEQSYSALQPIQEGWDRLLEAKQTGKKVYLLSNLSHEYRDYLLARYPLFSQVDGAIYSCDVRTIKPEAAIYEKLLRTYRIDPLDACFFDDKPENLLTAEKFGIQGHLVVAQETAGTQAT